MVKIYKQAPIELKVTGNNLCVILNTIQVELTPSVTQGSLYDVVKYKITNIRAYFIQGLLSGFHSIELL